MEQKKIEAKQNMTGYPSIDKPWLKYYSEEAINISLPKCTIYEYIWKNNKDDLENVALNYFGRKITYGEMFENIDKTAAAFSDEGIGAGDIVLGIAINIPEIIYSIYALNKIGAVSAWLDPRKSVDEIMDIVNSIHPKMVMLLDDAPEELLERFTAVGARTISYSVQDSLPAAAKATMMSKSPDKKHKGTSYGDMIKNYADVKSVDRTKSVKNPIALIVYTGGTTGASKGVMLSNENINSVVAQYVVSGVPLGRDHSWLTMGSTFIVYALIMGLHTPLSIGMTCYICLDFEVRAMEKIILDNRINHTMNTPMLWEYLIQSELSKKADYSFLINPTVGADSMDINKEEEISDFLEQHNCKYPIIKGYGMTEVSSAVSVNVSKNINKIGSVGIPFCAMVISAFDPLTGEECRFDEQGEICITGPSVMAGYFDNKEATDEMIRRHSDGRLWLHSGDLGHIDSDGFLFIDGRLKRMIIDYIGFKIFAPAIETAIMDIAEIDKCCVVGSPDREHQRGQIAVAFVIAKQGVNTQQLVEKILKVCRDTLPSYSQPARIVFVEQFPYTGAGKVDYRALEKEAERTDD